MNAGPLLPPQTAREALLAALLDVTLAAFDERLAQLGEAGIDALPEDVIDYGGRYFGALRDAGAGDPNAPQILMQVVASLADVTLLELVRVFGTVPAGVQAP